MITIPSSGTIQGKATTGGVVNYTIHGDSLSGSTNTFTILAQGQLSTSIATLYTATSVSALVSDIHLSNTSGSSVTINLYEVASSTTATSANQTISLIISANGTAVYTNNGWQVFDAYGNLQQASTIVLTGDISGSGGNPVATTLATVNANVGSFGSTTTSPSITVNAKGLVTAASSNTIAPPFSAVTGQATLAQLPSIGATTILGNSTGSTATPTALSVVGTQTLLSVEPRGTQTIASAAGTTTLTSTSPRQTIITGTATQIIVLPNATTIPFIGWTYEFDNQSSLPITVQYFGGTVLLVMPPGSTRILTCTSIATTAGTWQFQSSAQQVQSSLPAITEMFNGLDVWGHSWLENPLTSATLTSLGTNSNENFGHIFAAAVGIPGDRYVQHARTGSMLTGIGRGGSTGGGHFAKMLAEIFRTKQTMPFTRSGNAHLICWGINDIGNNTSANQTLLRSCATDILTVLISKARASVIFNAQGGANLAFGSNFANAALAAEDYTSGFAKSCTVVDSSGTSTVTFTIPIGYQGEPICFALGGLQAGSLIVTWGGTAGITGTTTLSSRALNSNSIVPYRITTLTSANAGQTITCAVTTISSSTFYFDGVWLEALKPVPVLVCNTARLPQRKITWASGAGTTTGATTAFTDASVQFASSGGWVDTGATLTETDAQGAFTGNTNTISSVTNATTVVLGTAATGAKSNIKYTIQRTLNGYASGLYWTTNTDFTGATVASHSAADTDVTSWNTMISTVVGLFDSMVQVVDLDGAVGGDLTVPSSAYTWFNLDGGHFNALGAQAAANAVWLAASKLTQPVTDVQPIGAMITPGIPTYNGSPYRHILRSGTTYLPDNAIVNPTSLLYTAVAGDCFAYPFFVTEASEFWTTVLMDQSNAGTTVLAVGVYDDVAGPNGVAGYPQCLVYGNANYTMSTAAVNTVGTISRTIYPGLNWLVVCIQSIGTASTFYTISGGNNLVLPGWNGAHLGTATNVLQPVAYKVTGVAAGTLPEVFPTGGVLAGANLTATGLVAPLIGVTRTLQ